MPQLLRPRPRVYIAGPITGDVQANTHRAVAAWHDVWDAGYAPYCPHLDFVLQVYRPLPYEDWMELDFRWLDACDALLRLPGNSPGADREVVFATERGIPVFHSLDELRLGLPATKL